MKPSSKRTTVAILRTFLDEKLRESHRPPLGQKGFAELIGKSLSTVQGLEIGRLPLSDETAKTISERTGVSVIWLLRGNLKAKMWEAPGIITRADWEKAKADYWAAEVKPKESVKSKRDYSLQSFDRASFAREEVFGSTAVEIAFGFDLLKQEIDKWGKESMHHPDGDFRLWKLRRAVEAVRSEFAD